MIEVNKTLTLVIEDKTYDVATQSAEVRQLVTYLDEWRQDEANLVTDLLKTRAALRDIQNTIVQELLKPATEQSTSSQEVDVLE